MRIGRKLSGFWKVFLARLKTFRVYNDLPIKSNHVLAIAIFFLLAIGMVGSATRITETTGSGFSIFNSTKFFQGTNPVLDLSNQSRLNVNSSDTWDELDTPADITEVGTIATGVWEGTAIGSAFIVENNPTSFPYDNFTGVPTTWAADNITGLPTTVNYDNITNPITYDQRLNKSEGVNYTGVNTTQLWIGSSNNRPLRSNGDVSVTACEAGCDYTTLQAAINNIPFHLQHTYTITLTNGTSGERTFAENIIIPEINGDKFRIGHVGQVNSLRIIGNTTNSSQIRIRSMVIASPKGTLPVHITGVEFYGENPHDDEDVSLAVYGGSGTVALRYVSIDCAELHNGILAYNGKMSLDNVTFRESATGSLNCSGYGVFTKYQSHIYAKDGGVHGSVAGYAFGTPSGGDFVIESSTTLSGNLGKFRGVLGMINYAKSLYGVDELMGSSTGSNIRVNESLTVGASISAVGTIAGALFNSGQGAKELYGREGDLLTTAPITGAANDVFYGADADLVTIGISSTPSFGNVSVAKLGLGDGSSYELELVDFNITISRSYHIIDTEGEIALDNLSCIYGGSVGDVLYLAPKTSSRDIAILNQVCADGTAKINAPSALLDTKWDILHCIKGYGNNGWTCQVINGG